MINGVSELWNYFAPFSVSSQNKCWGNCFLLEKCFLLRDLKFKVYLKEKLTPSLT